MGIWLNATSSCANAKPSWWNIEKTYISIQENRKRGMRMSFADNLKQIRKEHNLSQEEMAELLNVSRQAVSKWEQGVSHS